MSSMEVRVMKKLEGIPRCPQCGVASPSLTLEAFFRNPFDKAQLQPHWFCYRCETCNDLVGVRAIAAHAQLAGGAPTYLFNTKVVANRVIPSQKVVDADLPDRARRYLEQAVQAMHTPDGAVMLAGSAIDAMLKAKGLVEGSVYKRIEEAVVQGIITKEMSQWAHAVRLEANSPRHADIDDPHTTTARAQQVVEFAVSLGDFLFVLPARVRRGVEAAQKVDG